MTKKPNISMTQEEMQEFLYEELMAEIEPDLLKANRRRTINKLNTLSPEELKEKMEWYAKAFEKFVERWPAYAESVVSKLSKDVDKFKSSIAQQDTSVMETLEQKLSE